MADPNPDNNNPGEGSPDDFSTWDWHKIKTAVVGNYGSNANNGLSDPSTLYSAGNTLEYVKNALTMVAKSIQDQADALSYGDNAPWKGAAAGAFNQMMYTLSQNIHANAQVLAGDVASDDIPNQVYTQGQRLQTAINTLNAIDVWYAQQALARGASKDSNGYVMVHEDQQVVDAMTHDMRTVITNLSNHYQITNDGFTPPNTDNNPGPGNPPPGNDPNNPLNDPNNPFNNPNNPFGDGSGGGGGGGGSNFTPPPVQDFNPGGGDGGGGGGLGGGGGSNFTPPPVSNFPGGGGLGDPSGLGGPNGLGAPNGLGGPNGLGNNDLSNFTPPPVSNFPGGGGLGDPSGLGGPNGLGDPNGVGGPNGSGGQDFVPPPLANFPGGGGLGDPSGLGGNNGLGGSGLNNNNNLFNDKGGLDTSGLGGNVPPLKDFPGGGLGDGLGGAGGGVGGAGGGLSDFPGAGGLGNNLESSSPPPLSEFPGLDGSTTNLAGGPGGANSNMPGSGMPMSPGMGGMGGAGSQNNSPTKSDASGLLNPVKFPGDLGGNFDPSGLLNGGGGASSGGGGGLSGLDGLDGFKGLNDLTGAGGGGGAGADLPPVAGFPGGTDVSDPSLASLGGPNGLDEFGAPDPTGLTTGGLASAGGGAPGAPGSGMPMSPGMGGMGGAGQQNNSPAKSDASGLLNPTAFPGGVVDNAGDPSVLLSGGTGAATGSGGLSGLDLPQVPTFDGDSTPAGQPDNGISVDNPELPVQEATAQPQQAVPGMPMSPGMGGMGGAAQQNNGPTNSDASGLLSPTAFPGGVVDNAGDPSVLLSGGIGAASGQGAPMMVPPMVPPTQQPGTTAPGGDKSDASHLLTPERAAFSDNGFAEPHHGQPGGTEHLPTGGEPMSPPDRVAMVQGQDAAEDFTAWDAGGAASAGVLPWLIGRGGKDDRRDLQTDAPTEDNDKWEQGDLSGVPAPAEQQPHLATWRPEKVVTTPGQPAEEIVVRSSGAMPPPEAEQPEPEPDVAADEEAEEPERTSADLLDRRSDQWDGRGSDLPGVLG